MRISKHIHSCLLVEEENKTLLIDPGNYSYEEKALDLSKISKLDYLLITHEHQDHMYVPLVKEIAKKFPSVGIVSNDSVKKILEKEGLKVSTKSNEFIRISEAPHEKLPFAIKAPQNSLFTIFRKLTHPGDSLTFNKTSEILALPIQAPWTSLTTTIEKGVGLKPKIIIPIHDWHWKDIARKNFYQRAKDYLEKFNIDFKRLETGEVLET